MASRSGATRRRAAKDVSRAVVLLLVTAGRLAFDARADVPPPLGAGGEVPPGLRAVGIVARPPNSVPERALDAAWAAYTNAVGEADKEVWAAAERAAAAADGPVLKAYWQEALAVRERTGRWPAHDACAAVVGAGRKRCDQAFDAVVQAYQNLINALKDQKRFVDANAVKDELLQVRNAARSFRGRFTAESFGFESRAVFGHGKEFGSWEPNPELVFARLKLPLLQANGVLLISLREDAENKNRKVEPQNKNNDEQDLRTFDVVHSVAGEVIRDADDWAEAQAGLRLGQGVPVQVLRLRKGVWRPVNLVVLPVDDAGLQIVEIASRLTPKCPMKKDESHRQPILQEAIVDLPDEPTDRVRREFHVDDGPFAVLAVAIAREDDGAIVEALQALGPDRLQLLNKLALRTDWGLLAAPLARGMNNAKVLRDGWDAVIRTWDLDAGGAQRRRAGGARP